MKWFNKININIFLLAILIYIPMISFVVKIDNIIPITNISVLIVLVLCNYKNISKLRINIPILCYFILFILIILLNIMLFRI